MTKDKLNTARNPETGEKVEVKSTPKRKSKAPEAKASVAEASPKSK